MHHGASLHPAALGLFQVAAQDVLSNVTNDGLQSAKVQSTHASMYCEQCKQLHEGRIHERNMFNEVLFCADSEDNSSAGFVPLKGARGAGMVSRHPEALCQNL